MRSIKDIGVFLFHFVHYRHLLIGERLLFCGRLHRQIICRVEIGEHLLTVKVDIVVHK